MTATAERARADHRWLWALRAGCVVAVALSTAAFVDGRRGHVFCAAGSGCDLVRSSGVGRLLAPQLPLLGMLGFAFVLLASLVPRAQLRRVALAFGVTAGFSGLVLLALQAVAIGALCPLCAAVDVIAIGIGLAAFALVRGRDPWPALRRPALGAWIAALGIAVAGPVLWARAHPEPAPGFVRALQRPGVVTVVELSDFECPYCRGLHPVLRGLLAEHGDRVRLVRMSIPLPGHRHARDAARAYLCAGAQGRGEEMAEVLFSSRALSTPDCAKHARGLGLDGARFDACMADPATEQHVARDVATVVAAGLDGLPTVYIGETKLIGFDRDAGAEPYRDALERELSKLKRSR